MSPQRNNRGAKGRNESAATQSGSDAQTAAAEGGGRNKVESATSSRENGERDSEPGGRRQDTHKDPIAPQELASPEILKRQASFSMGELAFFQEAIGAGRISQTHLRTLARPLATGVRYA